MIETYYDILELLPRASIEDVKRAFKRLALIYHPDKIATGDRDKFEKIKDAYSFLKSAHKKALYDASMDTDNTLFNDMFEKIFDMMKTKLKTPAQTAQTAPTAPKASSKKPNVLKIKLKVTLDEVFKGDIKKMMVRLRRGDGWEKIPFYIDLKEHEKKVYKFAEQGDEEYGVKSDLDVDIEVSDHKRVKRDNVISTNDLYIEETMSLYEYYYGIDRQVDFLGDEKIHVKAQGFTQNDFYTYTHTVQEYGLPYIDDQSELCYGNLYIY